MKKHIIILICILILPIINAISLSSAQDVAKEYMQTSEFLDSSFYYVNCDSNEYFIISIIDGKENLSFFVPVESQNGNVIFQSNDRTKNILKTAYLNRTIKSKNSSGSNYLSQQLLDRIDNLNTVLKSKNARLDGIIRANYSTIINQKANNTKTKLETLITQLNTLHTNLSKLQKEQSVFLDTSNCKDTDNLLYLYKTSFTGYNKLISDALNYRESTSGIIEVVVADKVLDEPTKRMILSYTEAPTNLSSEINSISDWLSSTNQFYQGIVSEFEKTGPNSSVELLATKIKARQDFYNAKTALYSYDSELRDTLNNSIAYILNEKNIGFWKDTKTVTELNQNYNQIMDLYNKGRYTEAITKIAQAKSQVKKINREGIIEYEEETNYSYFIFAGSGLLLLLVIIYLFKKFGKIQKKEKKKTKSGSNDPEYLLNRRDPFR